MGKQLESITTLITRAIERGSNKHGDKSLECDEDKIICLKCDEQVTFKRENVNSRVMEHLRSKKHNANKNKKQSTLIKESINKLKSQSMKDEDFKNDLLDTFLTCDIPLHKLKMEKLKDFFGKYIPNQKVPHANVLRRRIVTRGLDKIEKIKNIIGDSETFFQIDGTSDRMSRNVVNVLVGKLDGTLCKPMLIHTEFQSVTNSKTIQKTIINACNILWPTTNCYPKLNLLLSDQAAYMILAGKQLKAMEIIFPNLKHVTCINHAISLVCNSITKEFYLLNKLFTLEKKWFTNGNKRKESFRSITKKPLIPFPVAIRWGTWIDCVNYHKSNLDSIRKYFDHVEEPKVENSLYRIKKILSGTKIEKDIIRLTDSYGQIPVIIKMLESESIKMTEQLDLLRKIENMVEGSSHYHIMKRSLDKNPDFYEFTSKDNSFTDKVNRTFAPLTSCSVERSFSIYRSIFRDNRTNLTKENLRYMLLVKFNNFI